MKSSSDYRALARETLDGRWNEFALLTLLVVAIAMVVSAPTMVGSMLGTLGDMAWLNGTSSGLSTVISILVIVPLEYAMYNLFLTYVRREEVREGNIHELFRDFSTNWSSYVVAGVLMTIVIVLVMLPTLFIGSIIFALAYSIVPFVIRDNPGIGAREALRLSRMMMRGHKADLFLLELSFIGWALLCCLCPIGLLWLSPYMYMSVAHFYEDVKAEYQITHEDLAA